MPKVGDTQTLPDGRVIYRHKEGWNFEPLTEDEVASIKAETNVSPFPTPSKKAATPISAALQSKPVQDFLRESVVGVAADIAGSRVGGKVAGSAAKRLALELLGGTVAGASASAGVAALQGRTDVNPIDEALTDRAMDLGFRGALSGAKSTYSGAKTLFKLGGKGTLAAQLVKRHPLAGTELSDAANLGAFAKQYDLPLVSRSLMSEFPDSSLLPTARTKFLNQIAKSSDVKILPDAIPDANIAVSPNQKASTDFIRKTIQTEYKIGKANEKAAWDYATPLIDSNVQTIAKMTPSNLLDQAGNPMMVPTPVDIVGPVDVTQHVQKIQEFRAAINEIDAQVNLDPVTKSSLKHLRDMMSSLTDLKDDFTGSTYVPFKTSKQIRQALYEHIDQLPVIGTGAQTRGMARSLVTSLVDAEKTSAKMWSPESQLAWVEAKRLTQTNAHRFNPNTSNKLVADEWFSTGEGHDFDSEKAVVNALKTVQGAENMVRAAGTNSQVGSLFAKIGLDRARKDNGTYDPVKLDEYFKGDFGKSILDSNVVTPKQRTALKGLVSYMKRNSFADINPAPNINYLDGKWMTSGIIAGGAIATGILTSNLAPAAITATGALIAIPVGRNFISRVIMSDLGADLFTKMIYAQTTQQKMRTQRNLLDYALSQGVRAWARYPDGKEEMLNSAEE